ncbi:MAG: hypothetical protein JSV45_08065 [Chromatiales bacterium]|nr:MAG: hypothetical protein JSV45_08065 [Chromatiales bacterium]
MKLRWTTLVLLAVMAGNAAGQDELPDEDFLAFLGGLAADDDWEVFFDSVPDDLPAPPVVADIEPLEAEEEDELD